MPKQAHLLSDDRLRRTGYRLLCSIYAEYEWRNLRRDTDPDILDDFLGESGNEISELLVTLAALARASDDALDTLSAVAQVFPYGVGVLREEKTEAPLSPREACNKVIHAESVKWEFDIADRNPLYARYYERMKMDVSGTFKSPRVVLIGTHRRTQWEAAIELVPFVIAVANWDAYRWAFS